MTSSAPSRGTTAHPASAAGHKRQLSISQAERQYRIMPNQMCTNARTQLDNINRMIAAAETEYRASMLELDALDREGRMWLAVDFIHKTSLASLDMAASLLQMAGLRQGDAARAISDATQTGSEIAGTIGGVFNGTATVKDVARTTMSRVLTHTSPGGVGGTFAKGTADIGLTGWSNIDNITGAKGTPSATARQSEAGIDLAAGLVQRAAETLDKGDALQNGGVGNPTAKKVAAVATLTRAMASYNREIEGVFNRRLETSSSLQNSRALLKAAMDRNMTNFRRKSAEITQILASCQ